MIWMGLHIKYQESMIALTLVRPLLGISNEHFFTLPFEINHVRGSRSSGMNCYGEEWV